MTLCPTSGVAQDPPAACWRAVHDMLVVRHVCWSVGNTETVLESLHQILDWLGVWVNGYEKEMQRENGSHVKRL